MLRFRASLLVILLLVVGAASWPIARASEDTRHRQVLLTDQAGLGAVGVVSPGSVAGECRESAVYIEWSAGVSAGAVTIESAAAGTYGGTWASLAAVTFAPTAPKADLVQITGVHEAVRARVSTGISGGTVTVKYVCN